MFGAGYIGIGNERLLVTEYSAVLASISTASADAGVFRPFLAENIAEDSWHAALIERAASGLASLGYPPLDFYDGAVAGVDARIAYYDALDGLYSVGDDG